MIEFSADEKLLLVVRRHWYAYARHVSIFAALLIAPSAALLFASVRFPFLLPATPLAEALGKFFLALYLLTLVTVIFVVWLTHYLTAWIITNRRVIAIRQRGLFHREVSEMAMERIENVTAETPGFIATVLDFGNVKIETAGESGFTIATVAGCDRARDIILKCSQGNLPAAEPANKKN